MEFALSFQVEILEGKFLAVAGLSAIISPSKILHYTVASELFAKLVDPSR